MADEKSLPFGKHLASSDKKTRDNAIKDLASYLSESTEPIPEPEMAKLWKGIFYCFWMSDKPLVQQTLAGELADIVLNIPTPDGSLAFLRGFWEALVREWSGIDRLRIDKYYLLIRRFVNATFKFLARSDWDEAILTEYNTILTEQGGPLCPQDMRIPTSLTYHLADIYVEELNKASTVPFPLPTPLLTLLNPYLNVAAHTPAKLTYQRIQSALIDPLLEALSIAPPVDEENEGPVRKRQRMSAGTYDDLLANACSVDPRTEGVLPRRQLKKLLLQRIFDVASQEQTRDANRRKMYAIWKSNAEEDDDDEERPPNAKTVFS